MSAAGRLGAEESAALWAGATSYAELCALAARFLAGELASFPGWRAADTDAETDELAVPLTALCRAGFLPVASQPGAPERVEHDGRLWRRRAFVCGFAPAPLAARLAALDGPELWVDARPAGAPDGPPMPVGLRGGEPFLVLGHAAHAAELELFADACGPRAVAELARAVWVAAADREWGREGRLWTRLVATAEGAAPRP